MKQLHFHTKEKSMFKKAFALIAVVSLLAVNFGYVRQASALAVTTPRDYLSRQQASVLTGIQHDIFFTEASGKTSTDNEVRIIFPDADDGLWCRTLGSLTATGITDPVGASESATGLLGTLSATCAVGSGSGTPETNHDRLLITGVGALVAATKYGVRLVGNVGVLGTAAAADSIKVEVRTYEDSGTLEDTGTLALSLIASDQIAVSATVDPTLTVALNVTTAALGTLSTSNVNQAGIISTVSTNANSGFVSMVKYGATLTSGSDTVPATSGGTIVAGTAEFGASSSDASNTIAQWSPTACTTTSSTSNATALSTSFQSYSSSATAVSGDATTLCFLASITATQQPGSYTSTATVVTTAKF